MKYRFLLIAGLLLLFVVADVDVVLAGPGGAIAKGLFKSTWGKILMLLITIILAPILVYIYFKELIETRKNKKILLSLGKINNDFSWLNIEKNVRTIFMRVYDAWDEGKMQEVSTYVTHWYWQNQQIIYLDRWEKKGLKNHCGVSVIKSVKPLYLDITEEENLEGSKIAFSITANIQDYLLDTKTNKVVEGSKNFGDEEKIWIMEYNEGSWKLDNIDTGDTSLTYAKLVNVVPQHLLKQKL